VADLYTTTTSVDYAQVAYDRLAYFAFRPQLYFDQVADVQPTNQAMPGSSVIFTIQNDLAVASTPLSETLDVSAVALSDSQVTVTLYEYGNAAITTAKLRGTAFVNVNPIVANVIGFNAGVSIDTVARNVLVGGTNVDYSTGSGTAPTSRATVTYTSATNFNGISSHDCRVEVAKLRSSNVPEIGNTYVAYIHPDVSLDLRETTGDTGWRQPHDYSAPDNIWVGEIGTYEGARFIETPRAPTFLAAGASSTNVYATLFVGRQSLAKAYSTEDGNGPYPQVVEGPVVDKLRRQQPMGWYWLGGYNIFRQAAVRRLESATSIGAALASDPDVLAIDA
jgi:N4-gp56 family major capsid protein